MTEFGISRSGTQAEQVFREITGAELLPKASQGDALFEGTAIEVKKVKNTTLNQVRAVKYLPTVVYRESTDSWYVIPAHRIVQAASKKTRGQHNENPFECANFSITSFPDCEVSGKKEIASALRIAITESARANDLRSAMVESLRLSREAANKSISSVKALLKDLHFE